MKNKFRLYIAMGVSALLLTQPAAARHLSPTQSFTRAQSSESRAPGMRKIHSNTKPELVKTVLTERQGLPAFYVFENAGNLLITAADDRLPAILGYSDSGSFSEIPANMQWWLEQYQEEIGEYYAAAPEADTFTSTYDLYAAWSPIEPLCKTEWNQTSPFNDQCPMLNGTRTVTGCVATALAQVIRYKGYLNCRGKKSYKWEAGNQTLTFDFDNYKVDFSLLRDAYKGGATQAQRDEVAKLMYAIAIAVNSNFNTATGATYNDGIRDYLGFGDYFTIERAGITTQEWEKTCYNLIKDGNPLAYAGTGTGGHAFVCDGYSDDGFFHFNWGWGGLSNGYFRLSALNPRDQGTGSFEGGYTMGQNITVLLGDNDEKTDYYATVRPGTVVWDTRMALNVAGCTNSGTQNTCTLNLGIQYALTKSIAYSENVGIGLILYNRDQKSDPVYIEPSQYSSMMVQQTILKTASIKFSRSLLTAGAEYDAYPVYAFKNHDGYWRLSTYGSISGSDHWLISVADNYKVSCAPETPVNLGLHAYNMETNDLYIGDNANTFRCLLVNSSPEDINETISLRLYQQTKDDQYDPLKTIATSYMLLSSGESMELEATFSLSDVKTPGNYALMFYNDTRHRLLGAPSELHVVINEGKRPEDEVKKPTLNNNYQVALWSDGKMTNMAPMSLISGDDLKIQTSLISATSQDVTFSLGIFRHGETWNPLAKYPAEKYALKGNGTWLQGPSLAIKPELGPGVYTIAFIDEYEGLVSYPADLYIDAQEQGVRYRFDPATEGMTVNGHDGTIAGAVEIPASVQGVAVKAVSPGAFDRCLALTSVSLPAGIISLGANSFRGISGLKHVIFDGKDVPFANSVIPFAASNPETEYYVEADSHADYSPAFNYRGHSKLYALLSALSLPGEATTDVSKPLELDIDVTPSENYNPAFAASVSNPEVLSAEVKDGKLIITPVAAGEAEVELTSLQPVRAPKAAVKVTITDNTDSLSEINAQPATNKAFDLLGRPVNANTRGIIIRNGKKTVNK